MHTPSQEAPVTTKQVTNPFTVQKLVCLDQNSASNEYAQNCVECLKYGGTGEAAKKFAVTLL